MSSGEIVAVKVLATDSKQGEKEFQTEVMLLGRLHHRNLVNLVRYCAEKRQHMLIYVYMSKGSLASHLYSNENNPVSWDLRVHIALDVARGLEYLHDGESMNILRAEHASQLEAMRLELVEAKKAGRNGEGGSSISCPSTHHTMTCPKKRDLSEESQLEKRRGRSRESSGDPQYQRHHYSPSLVRPKPASRRRDSRSPKRRRHDHHDLIESPNHHDLE